MYSMHVLSYTMCVLFLCTLVQYCIVHVYMQALSVCCVGRWLLLVRCVPSLCQCGAASKTPSVRVLDKGLCECQRKSETPLQNILQGMPAAHRTR